MKTIHAQKPVRTVAPAETPVSLSEAKEHLRVDHDDEDITIAIYIAAATAHLDGWSGILGRCIVTQTWRLDMDGFPSGCLIRLPFADVQSVTVAYDDTAGAAHTLSAATYNLRQDAIGSGLLLAEGASWPDTEETPDAVRVTMVCGFGAASAVPAALKVAILMILGHMYSAREAVSDRPMTAVPMAVDMLVGPYRRVAV